jgi:hypothetical protein
MSGNQWGGRWELSVGDRALGSTNWDLMPEDSFEDQADNDDSESLVDLGDIGNDRAKDVCLQEWGTLIGPSLNNANSVVFSPRGWIQNPNSDFNSQGYIEFQFYNQDAMRNGVADSVTVQISRAGMLRLVTNPQSYAQNAVGTAASSSE